MDNNKMHEVSSGLYVGNIRHRRFTPVKHVFDYPIFMPLIDLDKIDELVEKVRFLSKRKWGVMSFYHGDYMEGAVDTKSAVLEKLHQLTGKSFSGKVFALCHLRYFGLYFSPVNFYYVFDVNNKWNYMLAEVSNTPWNERHYYAIPANRHWTHPKQFHVSPFNPLEQEYRWTLKPIGRTAFVHLETSQHDKIFDATLFLKKQPLTSQNVLSVLLKTPVMTIKVLTLIYWQALKLWLKGAIFYSHPENS